MWYSRNTVEQKNNGDTVGTIKTVAECEERKKHFSSLSTFKKNYKRTIDGMGLCSGDDEMFGLCIECPMRARCVAVVQQIGQGHQRQRRRSTLGFLARFVSGYFAA